MSELLGGSDTPDDMTADDALRGAAALRISDEQTVIVTLGAQGAVALAGQRELRASGRAVKAVDTTGAGDCFVGNLAAELSRQATLEYAVEVANLAASLCVQTLGAAVSMPHLDHDRLEAQSA